VSKRAKRGPKGGTLIIREAAAALNSVTGRCQGYNGRAMDLLWLLVDVVLHLDRHLSEIIQQYGVWTYLLLFLIVFCETGLVVTPFLPGDSLLFAVGTFAALGALDLSLVIAMLSVAAILGDSVNYAIGARIGPRVFRREGVRFLNRRHLDRTHEFYERYGAKTIVIARFVPIVRTFAPFVAGIGRMRYGHFLFYNVAGALLWAFRAPRVFAVALLGNVAPLLLVTGLMGALGLPWSLAMLPLPAVLLGLAVDDTFHLLWPLRGRPRPARLALVRSALRTGPPVLATTAILAGCVSTLALSGLEPNRELGLLLAAGLVVALGCDLSLVPALLAAPEPLASTSSGRRSAPRPR